MLFTQRSTLIPTAALVAASLLSFTSAAPSAMVKRNLAQRGMSTMDMADVKPEDAPKPPPNPADQPNNQIGPTGLYFLTYNTDPTSSVDSVVNFDTGKYGGKKDAFGGYCKQKDSFGCLAQDNGSGGTMTIIWQCSEIDSNENGKKALVWKKYSTCTVTHDAYGMNTASNVCMKDGDKPACKAFA